MAGIISSAINNTDSAGNTNIADPLLKKTKIGVESKVSQSLKSQFLSIENAGLALLANGGVAQRALQKIQSSQDVVGVVSDGVANMIGMIYNQVSQKAHGNQQQFTAQFVAAAPSAAISLMCQVLDMAEQAIGIKITPDLVAQCTQATAKKVLAKFKIGDAQIQQVTAAGKGA